MLAASEAFNCTGALYSGGSGKDAFFLAGRKRGGTTPLTYPANTVPAAREFLVILDFVTNHQNAHSRARYPLNGCQIDFDCSGVVDSGPQTWCGFRCRFGRNAGSSRKLILGPGMPSGRILIKSDRNRGRIRETVKTGFGTGPTRAKCKNIIVIW
jgi:hypothetical protein